MSDWIQITGWTLLHFVWQGTVLGLATAWVLRLRRRGSAGARYVVACGGFVTLLAAPAITATLLWQAAPVLDPPAPAVQAEAARTATAGPTGGHTFGAGMSMDAVRLRVAAMLPLVVSLWLAGIALLLVRMGGGLWRVHRLYAASLDGAVSRWQATCARLAARLGLSEVVRVVESRRVEAPTVVGWLRPVILLPIAALANLAPAQVEAILAHELAHVRRHDYLVNLLQSLGETALFYHPAVWWVSAQIRTEREHCCDDVALALSGDRASYAGALAALETWRAHETAPGLGATGGSLSRRVRRILRLPSADEPYALSRVVTLAVAVAVGVGIGAAAWPPLGASQVAAAGAGGAVPSLQAAGQAEASNWQVRETEHFEIRYGPALAQEVDRVEAAAERAYGRVSERLADNLSFRVPLILYRTQQAFERQDIVPGADLSGIASFSEPLGNRIVVLVEEWGDDVVRHITHELTHVFAFDVIPRHSAAVRIPLWIDEGLADYVVNAWSDDDESRLRSLVASGELPAMSTAEGHAGFEDPRVVYALGHAAFDFVEERWGQAAIRAFLHGFGPADPEADPYEDVLGLTPAGFDAAFTDYLRVRFAPGQGTPRR